MERELNTAPTVRRFRLMLSITVGAVLFLILVGGVVRSTGSGLGCPDWPKCFGQYVPPTDISQLPADYKEIFKVAGKEIADFDPFKTWIEYVNRLIGVLIGFFAVLTAFFSLFVYRFDSKLTWLSLLGLILIIVQGGIGAIVVKTHLATGMITLHMVIALATLMLYIGTLIRSHRDRLSVEKLKIPSYFWLLGGVLLLATFVQIILGTQVRENVDVVAENLGEDSRSLWIGALDAVYDIHKLFYYVVVVIFVGWGTKIRSFSTEIWGMRGLMVLLAGVLVAEIAFGLSMHHFGIPPILQPLHLLFATILLAGEFSILGLAYFARPQIKS
jgi:cytochrome c oxidase assembly protein subunit 15